MADQQEVIKEFADNTVYDDKVKDEENALLLETLVYLNGDCFYNVFVGKLF